jgi:hypothetical protein
LPAQQQLCSDEIRAHVRAEDTIAIAARIGACDVLDDAASASQVRPRGSENLTASDVRREASRSRGRTRRAALIDHGRAPSEIVPGRKSSL